ncbi:hypothetical protein DTO027B5_8540 [Paecilomyces variotii]|nr:hypothetical protein DTO169E5_9019 [Paecilomyces variotii]KAJ9283359.1 hypothetical protein DTO021C3_9051 [Paecilomyces variotii]KAJ9321827.1 hypothetical protein DTO027B3_7217 [Paecilomyces variotii]KAJ9328963.1 hypothetical protein DTO027B5_8540 [Paecilomyces variotii]KAJ9395840.1 hypothetical protein DTO282F9_7211 [Paecilomyces variotii]
MISLANSRPQSPSTESEYADSDEELVANRGIKDHNLLGHKGFERIWIREFGYPGTPPPELAEFLDPEVTRTKQMIGSIRSIFWLYGYKDLVELVDDPAYSLQDEIVAVPQGVRVVDFLLDRYWEEGKIPRYISETYEGVRWPRSFRVMPVFAIPERVTETATMHHITDLYPYARAQFFPDSVLCLKLKSHKKATKTIAQAEKKLAGVFDLDNETLWFRGLSLRALALSMSFFLPTIHPHSGDNELGPGLYAAKGFATATDYAHPDGAIMVFRDPDFNDLNVWRPDRSDWESLTAHWLQIPVRDLKIPQGYKTADFIIGAISESESRSMSRKSFAIPGERLQMACTSYDACKRLAASLVAIIYLSS